MLNLKCWNLQHYVRYDVPWLCRLWHCTKIPSLRCYQAMNQIISCSSTCTQYECSSLGCIFNILQSFRIWISVLYPMVVFTHSPMLGHQQSPTCTFLITYYVASSSTIDWSQDLTIAMHEFLCLVKNSTTGNNTGLKRFTVLSQIVASVV